MVEQGRLYELPPEEPTAQDQTDEDGRESGLTFEQAFARLEEIVTRLEGGEATLEDSLRLFEEGVSLARFCRGQLDRAETRIRVLVDGSEGPEERDVAAALEKEILPGAEDI